MDENDSLLFDESGQSSALDNGDSGSPAGSGFWDGAGAFFNGVVAGVSPYFYNQQRNQTALAQSNITASAITNAVKYLAVAAGGFFFLSLIFRSLFKK